MRVKALWLPLFLFAFAAPVHAQEVAQDAAPEEKWDDAGPYVSMGAALGFQTFDNDLGTAKVGAGFQVVAGYRFLPFLAAETELEYMSFQIENLSVTEYTVEPLVATANVKGILPLKGLDTLEPYALVGVGIAWTKTTDKIADSFVEQTAFAARFGAGVDLRLHERVTIGFDASYVLPTGKLADYDYVSLGLFKLGIVF